MTIKEFKEVVKILNEFDEPYELPAFTKINGELVMRRGIGYGPKREGYLRFWRDINRQHALEHGGKPIARPSTFYHPVEDLNGSNISV